MKRSPLTRRTPLRARAITRHPASRRARFLTEFAAAKKVVRARSRGRCEADASIDCTGRAEHTHHKVGRVHPRANEPGHLLDVCHVCHGWIHAHPDASYRAGWLLHFDEVPKETPHDD